MARSSTTSIWRTLIMSALVPVGVAVTNSPVSLSNFIPRIENLPSQCQSVYTRTIQGCTQTDFTSSSGCSSSCLNGLVTITREVNRSCANVDVPETSIIGVFLLGLGIPSLCPNAVVTTIAATSAAPTQQPPPPQTSSSEDDGDDVTTTTTSSAAAVTSTSSGIAVDPSIPTDTTLATSIATTAVQSANPPSETGNQDAQSSPATSAAAPQQTADTQKSNAESGGGSPFDVVAEGGAAPPSERIGSKVALSCILGTALLFTIFL
ncbi:hypothetical protein BU24DRAFT_463526 [Aaosphaeria arxii CBS 175.79]|uniref:Extracellular membrane protein CFEM domain-containing protein n=1 Tax=Aaosphaeria arxii CBS 175.79 TaxID=1450172 RepID=A0A6A5XPE1_9PLEO|nr:uncharacterized protein BU24DRAFT_463526 [Aaosphaeria arxii CBS 175.79]KAF2014769.1 hypothetical protein BU24DRAFT_463526 [Aaosphaeria arxii CBS 175.79]